MTTLVSETAPDISAKRRAKVREHARILGIVHYVLAGLTALFGLMFLIHIVVGIASLAGGFFPVPPTNGPAPPFNPNLMFGGMFLGMGSVALLLTEGTAVLLAFAGRSFMLLRNRTFLLVMSGLNCLNQPIGLVLGIFGFVFLLDKDVAQMFEEEREGVLDLD